LALTCGLTFLTSTAIAASPKVFDVRKLGARGDGKTLDTTSIQKALDAAGKAGGAVVRFRSGTYLSQPIHLPTCTTLLLDKGATLKATDDPKDYLPADVSWSDILDGRSRGPFINFVNGKDLADVVITGKGTIDGSGARWWEPAEEARRKVPNYTLPRPNLIRIADCKGLKVTGITLKNSPKFHLVPENCEDVLIEGVTILAPPGAANTDAIDPSSSRRVMITNCVIDVGDDNVAIKAGRKIPGREFACEDITVTDCVIRHGHGISIGSETAGGVRNVTVRRCSFENTDNGLRIKSPRGRGGRVENVSYSDITMTNVNPAILITCYYPKIPLEDEAVPMTSETPIFQNLRISHLQATCVRNAGIIIGLPESPVKGVVLEDIRITSATEGLTIRNAQAVELKNVKVHPAEGPPFIVKDAQVQGLED
jgi:polygalacturonase